jgi:transposase
MSRQRYSPEFKDEAVRQVTDRGRPVVDVAERLGVSSHSLYKWVREARPSKDEKRSDELLESKKEVQRLRAELRRVEEERDILKKAAAYFARNPEESTPSFTLNATGSQ